LLQLPCQAKTNISGTNKCETTSATVQENSAAFIDHEPATQEPCASEAPVKITEKPITGMYHI
jgi:hypothetical protein